jgi:hypothetical protein
MAALEFRTRSHVDDEGRRTTLDLGKQLARLYRHGLAFQPIAHRTGRLARLEWMA